MASGLPGGVPTALSRGTEKGDSLPAPLHSVSALAVQSAAAHRGRAGNTPAFFLADLQNAAPDCVGCRVSAKAEPPTAPNKPRASGRRDWHGEAWQGCGPGSCPSLGPSHLTHPCVPRARAWRMRGSPRRPGPLPEVLPRRHSGMRDSKHAEPVKTFPLTWPILRSA